MLLRIFLAIVFVLGGWTGTFGMLVFAALATDDLSERVHKDRVLFRLKIATAAAYGWGASCAIGLAATVAWPAGIGYAAMAAAVCLVVYVAAWLASTSVR